MTHAATGPRVIGIGVSCLDQLVRWRDMKAPVLGNEIVGYDVQGGGMAATAMVAAARLGCRAEYWGAVGDDWSADLILRGLADEGVDTQSVVRVPGKTGPLMIVCIDGPTGERHFTRWTGVCDAPGPVGSLDRLAGAACLLTDDTRPETDVPAAAEARRLGVPVVADVGWINERTLALLPHVDYAIASEECARVLAGGDDVRQACASLCDLGARCAVVTLGRAGLVYLDGGRFERMEAFAVDVVDTTGAGDVFHGAFAFAMTQGWSLKDVVTFASAVSAIKCTKVGGRAGIPTFGLTMEFLAERGVGLPAC